MDHRNNTCDRLEVLVRAISLLRLMQDPGVAGGVEAVRAIPITRRELLMDQERSSCQWGSGDCGTVWFISPYSDFSLQ